MTLWERGTTGAAEAGVLPQTHSNPRSPASTMLNFDMRKLLIHSDPRQTGTAEMEAGRRLSAMAADIKPDLSPREAAGLTQQRSDDRLRAHAPTQSGIDGLPSRRSEIFFDPSSDWTMNHPRRTRTIP
jgi:hypothetical protein